MNLSMSIINHLYNKVNRVAHEQTLEDALYRILEAMLNAEAEADVLLLETLVRMTLTI